MTIFEQIKNLKTSQEMAEFLGKDPFREAEKVVCEGLCQHRDSLGQCTIIVNEDCPVSPLLMLKLWLESEATIEGDNND